MRISKRKLFSCFLFLEKEINLGARFRELERKEGSVYCMSRDKRLATNLYTFDRPKK